MLKSFKGFLLIVLIYTLFWSCSEPQNNVEEKELKLFQKLDQNETGVNFNNPVNETVNLNLFSWKYIYNGGGVALGDINNDGL
jgi:hypothetical protein